MIDWSREQRDADRAPNSVRLHPSTSGLPHKMRVELEEKIALFDPNDSLEESQEGE